MNKIESWESLRLPATPPSSGPLTVRRFVILTSSFAAATFVWHRTGGDLLLTAAALLFVHGALSHWLER